jgi:hypothetical protein
VIVQTHCALQFGIAQRQDIRSLHVKYQKHFRCPAIDTPDTDKLFNDAIISPAPHFPGINAAITETHGQLDQVSGFVRGQTASTQLRHRHGCDRIGIHRACGIYQALPDRLCSLDGRLLADDRTGQRDEGLAPALKSICAMNPGQFPEYPVLPGKRRNRLRPVFGCHRAVPLLRLLDNYPSTDTRRNGGMDKQPGLSCTGDADGQPMGWQWMIRPAGMALVSPRQSER